MSEKELKYALWFTRAKLDENFDITMYRNNHKQSKVAYSLEMRIRLSKAAQKCAAKALEYKD